MKSANPQSELAPTTPADSAVALRENPTVHIAGMLQAVVDKGVTKENVEAMKELVGLYERMQAKSAEQEFSKAFVQLQQEMPNIKGTEVVPNRDGSPRYKFAPYEKIMAQVQPLLVRHGFTLSFSTKYDDKRIVKMCTLRHTAGHSVTNEFAVRIGSGPPSASEAQADGAAGTYAKRMALCDCLNIVVEKDNDARLEGATISKEQATSLRLRVKQTGSDESLFLRFAQVPISDKSTEVEIVKAYESISEGIYPTLDASLRKKEKT